MTAFMTVVFTVDGRADYEQLLADLRSAQHASESIVLVTGLDKHEVFVHHTTRGDTAP